MTDPAERLARIRSRFAETWIEVSRRDMQWLLDHVDQLTAERDSLRTIARSTATTLRDTAERVEQHRTVNAASLRAQAKALDEITQTKET